MRRPRVKAHVAFVPVSPDVLLVKGPALFVRYSGEAVPLVLDVVAKLDGTRDLAQVARETGHAESDVRDVVEALWADRVVEDAALDGEAGETRAPDATRQLLSHLSSQPAAALARVRDARVVVLGEGALAATTARLLREAGVGRVETPRVADWRRVHDADLPALVRGATHAVLALEAPLHYAFLAMNDACMAENVAWTAIALDGLDATVGPTVLPRQTACWRCYDLRVKGAHPNLGRLLAYEAHARDAPASLGTPGFAEAAAGFAAHALTLTLSGAVLPPLAGQVARIGMLDLRAEKHRVLRVPRCPACSPGDVPDVDRYAIEPVTLP